MSSDKGFGTTRRRTHHGGESESYNFGPLYPTYVKPEEFTTASAVGTTLRRPHIATDNDELDCSHYKFSSGLSYALRDPSMLGVYRDLCDSSRTPGDGGQQSGGGVPYCLDPGSSPSPPLNHDVLRTLMIGEILQSTCQEGQHTVGNKPFGPNNVSPKCGQHTLGENIGGTSTSYSFAPELQSWLDTNKDGHISLEEWKAGIFRAGQEESTLNKLLDQLGFGDDKDNVSYFSAVCCAVLSLLTGQ